MTTLNLENLPSEEDKNFVPFPSRRSVVHATKGIISSTQPLANEAGYRILAKGGNAADAAVAVAAALNVTGLLPRQANYRTTQHRSETVTENC
jgi:gamma-glutamyltranspeptidase / glutathione hydrolase